MVKVHSLVKNSNLSYIFFYLTTFPHMKFFLKNCASVGGKSKSMRLIAVL